MRPPDWAGQAGPDCPSTALILSFPSDGGSYFEDEIRSDPLGLFTEMPLSLLDALNQSDARSRLAKSSFTFLRVKIPFGRAHEVSLMLRQQYDRVSPEAGGLSIEEDDPGSFDFMRGGLADTYQAEMGVQAAHQANVTGALRCIAILDSGLNKRGQTMIDATVASAQNTPAVDAHGHGTAMHDLMAQIAPDAVRIPIRICEAENTLSIWGAMIGLYLASGADADIISMSFGFSQMDKYCPNCGGTAAMRSFALECVAMQVAGHPNSGGRRPILVAATGNRHPSDIRANRRMDVIKSPASFQCVVSVGSVDSRYGLSLFSNYDSGAHQPRHVMGFGGQVDQAANPTEDVGQLQGGAPCYGTSPATAYVSAILALLWSDSRYAHMGRETFLDAVEQSHCFNNGAMPRPQFGSGLVCWDPLTVTGP